MITVRRSQDRGSYDHGWLRTSHSFSFADYQDPRHMGYRSLRVINEDHVQPGQGFPTHSHRNMEIVTLVLSGVLEHRDSMGNSSLIRPGEVQRMTAGSGVTHSEYNASKSDWVHLLQIWILPNRQGLHPSYEQKTFDPARREGRWRLLCSPDGEQGSVIVHQDAWLYETSLKAGAALDLKAVPGRGYWLQMISGRLELGGERLSAGDGAAVDSPGTLSLRGLESAHCLLFDLA
ncbi:MAG: Quercetin 2,3-dioxygenase [Candidatus Omnitrophica bacterium]|nr:Quercetin 2,3-dioxygenase [Candidatus Omnitrophota bacterium]